MIQIQIKNLADVPEALALVNEEVGKVKKAINDAGAKAQKEDRRQIAREALDYADGLDAFIKKIEKLGEEWKALEASIEKATPEAREIVRAAGGTRVVVDPVSPKSGLRVTFPDGTVIAKPKASTTQARTIERLGPAAVAAFGFRMNGEPLLTRTKKDLKKYPESVETLRGGWILSTHSNTQRKADDLKRIADRLGVRLKIEIVPSHPDPGGRPTPLGSFPYKVGQVVKAVFPVLQRDARMKKEYVDDLLDASSSARFKTGGNPVFKERKGIPDETRDAHGHHRYYPQLPLVFHGRRVWLTSQFDPPAITPVLDWLDKLGMSRSEVLAVCEKAYGKTGTKQGELPL
jgi:soluble cytochrome b562